MIPIPAALQARLDEGATTLAWCWRVERRDGEVFGFTDHDAALAFDGVVYEPEGGFSPGAARAETGFAPARAAAFGALDSERIGAADLDNGVWDAAGVEIYRVDWTDPSLRWRAFTGEIAHVKRTETGFEAEIAGLTARLDRTIGRVFATRCDAELGDARCGVDLADPAFAGSGSVAAPTTAAGFAATGLEGFEAGWFAGGVLTWTGGANAGARQRVEIHRVAGGETILELETPPAAGIAAGDGFDIVAGCDKRAETCREKFDNLARFRGFPHMPGNDVLMRHAASGIRRDGSAR